MSAKGTRVTTMDIETGEEESHDIINSFVLTTDGTCYVASKQAYANGTVVITIKFEQQAAQPHREADCPTGERCDDCLFE